MKKLVMLLVIATFVTTGCDKSEIKEAAQTTLPVTNAVKTGDWMMTYFENNASTETSLTFVKFSSNGTLSANKDGVTHNGTWTETNALSNNTLTLNIATTDVKLLRANRAWKVTNISEFFIDLKDVNASTVTMQLMKH